MSGLLDELRRWKSQIDSLPRPRFDRVAAHDLDAFAGLAPATETFGLPVLALGVPVLLDPDVEAGYLELRKGDEVIERVRIA